MAAATTTAAAVAWSQRVEMPTAGDDTDYCLESCGDGMMVMMMRRMTTLLRKIATLDFDLAVEAAVVATGLLAANQVCLRVCVRASLCVRADDPPHGYDTAVVPVSEDTAKRRAKHNI